MKPRFILSRMGLFCILAAIAFFASTVRAQEYRARIQGVVTDPTKAAVPGAKVTLTNVNTGVETVKETDTSGHYIFDFVLPGSYKLAVEASGFSRFVQENINVLTRGDVTLDAELKVGRAAETITVVSDVAQLTTNTATMTTTVQGNMLRDIPVLARNPFTLALLNPAVINRYWDVSHRNPFYMWSSNGLDIGGRTGGKNDMQLDGAPLGVSARGSYMPSMDGVQEVTVEQNAIDSEFGFSAGGTLNVSMKSGTNDFHGTAYYFGRNPALNAKTNRITGSKSLVRNHIWGGTVGGPVKKDKIFFYSTYEQWKNTQPQLKYYTAPTDLERTGDFSKSLQSDGALRPIYDPWSTKFDPVNNAVTRTPFPGNVIPQDRINPTGQKIVNQMYKPNNPGDDLTGINNVKVSYPWYMKYWNISERADYNINDRMRMYARYSKYQTRLDNPNWGNAISVQSDNGGLMDALQPTADFLWMISPSTTIDMRYGAVYVEDDYDSGWAKVPESVWNDLWPNGWYKPVLQGLPGIYYPRFNFYGNGDGRTGLSGWWLVHARSHNGNVNVTHDQGMHHMKIGWQLRYQYDQNGSPGPGSMNFNSVDTGASWLGYSAAKSGSAYASALLGVITSGNASMNPMKDSHQQLWAFFFQDDVHVTRRLTLNLGLRYELETAPSEFNRMYSRGVDLSVPIPELANNPPAMPSQVTSIYKGNFIWNGAWLYTDDKHPGVFNSQKDIFLPRVGLAYRIGDKTVLRAGWARYSVPWISIYPETNYYPMDGFSRSTSMLGPLQGIPRATADNPFPAGGEYVNPLLVPVGKSLGPYMNLGSGIGATFPPDMIHPINDRLNVSVQRELPLHILTDTTFFTMLGHNVQDSSMWGGDYTKNLNLVDPRYAYTYKGAVDVNVSNPFYMLLPADKMPGSLRTQKTVSVNSLLRPYPQYGNIYQDALNGMSSHYYSLQFQAQKSMSNGLAFSFGYNYSREARSRWYDNIAQFDNVFTMLDSMDPRHYIRLAATYELPFGRGKQFLSGAPRWLDAVVGGWATSSIYMWNNGPLLNFGTMQAAEGDPAISNPTRSKYFNTSMFSVQPAYTARSNPWYYNDLRGFGFWSWDATAVKYFTVTERTKVEFRMEFYNFPNAFMPSQPVTSVTSSNFGKSTSVAGGNYGREIQYTVRIHF